MWISITLTNIYLASIRFGIFQYLCNTLSKSHCISTVLGILPYIASSEIGRARAVMVTYNHGILGEVGLLSCFTKGPFILVARMVLTK
jgi:hypothetical protein